MEWRLTTEDLRAFRACPTGIDAFSAVFPCGTPVNRDSIQFWVAREGWENVYWLAARIDPSYRIWAVVYTCAALATRYPMLALEAPDEDGVRALRDRLNVTRSQSLTIRRMREASDRCFVTYAMAVGRAIVYCELALARRPRHIAALRTHAVDILLNYAAELCR